MGQRGWIGMRLTLNRMQEGHAAPAPLPERHPSPLLPVRLLPLPAMQAVAAATCLRAAAPPSTRSSTAQASPHLALGSGGRMVGMAGGSALRCTGPGACPSWLPACFPPAGEQSSDFLPPVDRLLTLLPCPPGLQANSRATFAWCWPPTASLFPCCQPSLSVPPFAPPAGEQSRDFCVVLATNRPSDLDPAVIDRTDDAIEFGLPGDSER